MYVTFLQIYGVFLIYPTLGGYYNLIPKGEENTPKDLKSLYNIMLDTQADIMSKWLKLHRLWQKFSEIFRLYLGNKKADNYIRTHLYEVCVCACIYIYLLIFVLRAQAYEFHVSKPRKSENEEHNFFVRIFPKRVILHFADGGDGERQIRGAIAGLQKLLRYLPALLASLFFPFCPF